MKTSWKLPTALAVLSLIGPAPAITAAPAVAAETAARPAANTPTVTVVAATRREIAETVIVTGTLVPREVVQVSADVDGLKIEELMADAGDRVEAGAVLARLAVDSIDISLAQNDSQLARGRAAIAQARSQIVEAKASEVQAVQQLDRSRSLQAKGVIAQDVLDQRVAAADAARARLAASEQALVAAEADLALTEAQRRELDLRRAKTEIRAPKAGLVLSRAAEIGAIVSGQSGALFRVAADGLIELEADVTETLLARLAPGQPVEVVPPGATASITGRIRVVRPEVDSATRLGKVRVELPADAPLRAGSFARGVVETARRAGVALPVGAVVGTGEATVQVVKDGRIETRDVVTGLTGGGFVEIVEGLAEGEVVVARAGSFLRDGDMVTAVEAAAEAKG